MKVLLIGGSGYVGMYSAWYLKSKGMEVLIYDIQPPKGDWFEFTHGDIRDTERVCSIAGPYDSIVILSGLIGDPKCKEAPVLADELNHKAVAHICEKLEDKHIVFFSTCAVYGDKGKDDKLHENIPASPLSVYAETKLRGESHVLSVGGLVLRLGSVYGVGWEDVIRMDSIVNILTQKAIYEHSITILGGSQWKALISVRDVAGFLHEAILRSITGLYNLSARNYMLNEIGWHVANCIPGTQVIRGLEPPADRNYRIDNGRRLAAFRYDAKYSINEEIFRLKDLFQSIKK